MQTTQKSENCHSLCVLYFAISFFHYWTFNWRNLLGKISFSVIVRLKGAGRPLRSAQPSFVESWKTSVSRTKSTCHLLSDPGQDWLLISPKEKGLKERHDSFSVIWECDVQEDRNRSEICWMSCHATMWEDLLWRAFSNFQSNSRVADIE